MKKMKPSRKMILKILEQENLLDLLSEEPKKVLTEEDILQRLGLLPWNEFADKVGRWEFSMGGRRTGQTTQMLVKALELSQRGVVHLTGYSSHYTRDLVWRARVWAQKLGLDPMNIQPLPPEPCDRPERQLGRKEEGRTILTDHYTGVEIPRKYRSPLLPSERAWAMKYRPAPHREEDGREGKSPGDPPVS